jgi:hypothetical protein
MFEVLWKKEAELELAKTWLNAKDRNDITRAAHRIETALRSAPLKHGESRTGKDRILFDRPLGVSYRIRRRARQVLILGVWRVGKS